MKNFKLKSSLIKFTLALVIAVVPAQSIVAEDMDPVLVSQVSNGDVEAAKKLLLTAGINVEDEASVSNVTQQILQLVLMSSESATIQSTIETAVASMTRAVFELATEAKLSPEETTTAVEATAQGAVTAVVKAPAVSEANLSAAVAASSKGATSGAMLAASAAQQDSTVSTVSVAEAAKAATEGSMVALSALVEDDKPLSVVVDAVQAAAVGASQAAVATAVAVNADPATIVTAVAASVETGADSISDDNGINVVLNEAVSSGVQQGTLAGANEAGITGEAANDLAGEAQAAADDAASNDSDSGDSDVPDPVISDPEDDSEVEASPSTGA